MEMNIKSIATRMRAILDEFITRLEKWPKGSRGLCLPASIALQKIFENSGIDSRVIRGKYDEFGHAWVEVNGSIVDITHDQFGPNYPDVFLGEINDKYKEVVNDQNYDREMGTGGDDEQINYIDDEGEETPLGTTISIANKLYTSYQRRYFTGST